MIGIDFSSMGEWLRNDGPDRDVVISSRVRLARNLAGFNFVNHAERVELLQLVAMAREHVSSLGSSFDDELFWIDLSQSESSERRLLAERHLISRGMAKGDEPRAVAVNADESVAIMINEEDHYRIQAIRSGHRPRETYEIVNKIDDYLEGCVQYAFHKRFGYLTACPTNIGTGIRVSMMLHLPALTLTNEIERVRRASRDMQLALRGSYGEGSEALGDLYQISNQTTLEKSEEELLDEFEQRLIPVVIAYERQARQVLLHKRSTFLDDRCFRALGVLRSARLLKVSEAMKLLSHVRLGVELDRIPDVSIETVNRLLLFCQTAHLQRSMGGSIPQAQRQQSRAEMFRAELTV